MRLIVSRKAGSASMRPLIALTPWMIEEWSRLKDSPMHRKLTRACLRQQRCGYRKHAAD
jgi:hypothetical protein